MSQQEAIFGSALGFFLKNDERCDWISSKIMEFFHLKSFPFSFIWWEHLRREAAYCVSVLAWNNG